LDTNSSVLKILDQNMGFFLCVFEKEKPECKFVLSPTTKVMGYSSLKKYLIGKSTEAIEGQEKNPKEKVQR
jgi:hypothetical protein